MTEPKRGPTSPAEIFAVARAFMQSRVLLTAVELGVFTALDKGSRTADQVATALGTDPRGVDRLMNALCAMGFLAKDDGRFANSEAAGRFLVQGKPEYVAGLLHAAHLYRSWGTLTDAVRRGGSVLAEGSQSWDEAGKAAFIAAMHGRGWAVARQAAAALDLTGVGRVLDVGGGSGLFSMAMARIKPGLAATVFDLPDVVPLTQKYVAQEGLSDRVDTMAGDYHVDDLPTGYDLVLLSAIVHSCSPGQNERLIRKCAAAANPGGQVVVQDHLMSEDRTLPPDGAFFALNMLVNTAGGDTYTEAEITQWLKDAGLIEIRRLAAPGSPGILVGRKR
jgi:SAM-dependent methyltransferase